MTDRYAGACRVVIALIDDVVHDPDLTVNPAASRSADDDPLDPMDDGEAASDSIDILGSLLTYNERFRRKINERHLPQDLEQVHAGDKPSSTLEFAI